MKVSTQSRMPAHLSDSLERNLKHYALAASVASVGVLATAPPAGAKVVFTPANTTIVPGASISLDLNHDGINDFTIIDTADSRGHSDPVWLSVLPGASHNKVVTIKNIGAADLPAGVRVGPKNFAVPSGGVMAYRNPRNGTDGTYSVIYRGAWANAGKGAENRFLGLKFTVNGQTHFGWARLSVPVDTGQVWPTAVLTGYAYETVANKPIVTGDIHGSTLSDAGSSVAQPATLGRLAQGAAATPKP